LVTVGSVKNGNSHSLIDGISVVVKSAKGEIRVSESDTWLAKMIPMMKNRITQIIRRLTRGQVVAVEEDNSEDGDVQPDETFASILPLKVHSHRFSRKFYFFAMQD
jgi:hypothetical protein